MAYLEQPSSRGASELGACCSSCDHGGGCAGGLGLAEDTKGLLKTVAILSVIGLSIAWFAGKRVRLT